MKFHDMIPPGGEEVRKRMFWALLVVATLLVLTLIYG